MWKHVTIGLLAANVLFLAWVLMVAPPADPAARGASSATSRPAEPAAPSPAVAAPPSPPPRCVSLGPFGDPAVTATVAQRLVAAGLAPATRDEKQQNRDGYWVVIESANQPAQRAMLAQIRGAGIQDAYAMPDDAQFRVSLGIYSDRGRAEQRVATLRPLRLSARVEEHFQERAVQWLDVPEAGDRLSASRLEGFGITDSEIGAFDCPAPAAP